VKSCCSASVQGIGDPTHGFSRLQRLCHNHLRRRAVLKTIEVEDGRLLCRRQRHEYISTLSVWKYKIFWLCKANISRYLLVYRFEQIRANLYTKRCLDTFASQK
jgi:hypothetical protein